MNSPDLPVRGGETVRRTGEGSACPSDPNSAGEEGPLTPTLSPRERERERSPSGSRVLAIGIGNPLRGDDGAGWRVADGLEARWGRRVRVLRGHQVLPEWAPALAEADLIYFVDASVGGTHPPHGPSIEALAPAARVDAASGSHGLDPAALLRLALELFGRVPEAYLISIPGESFGYGDGLSPAADRAVRAAAAEVDVALTARLMPAS